jgi:hypothetical protein
MRTAKSLLEIPLVFGFATFLAVAEARHDTFLWWLSAALAGMGLLLNLRGSDKSGQAPWTVADLPWWRGASFCTAMFAGRVFGNWWLNTRLQRSGSVLDDFAWIFLILGIYSLGKNILKLRNSGPKTQTAL